MKTDVFENSIDENEVVDVMELGKVAEDTKGGVGAHALDGGAGWWF